MGKSVLTLLFFFATFSAGASTKPEAQVKGAKGPVQITLRLQKTAVKVERSLWYKIELKNIGKKKLRIDDAIFKDPYAMHVNSKSRFGIYLEIVDSNGNPLQVVPGNYRVKYDWEPPAEVDYLYTAEEKKELWALVDEWKKSGMTAQQQSISTSEWDSKLREKKNTAELTDPANKHWLAPGASTSTFAWSDRGPGDYPGRSQDDESLRQGYTELWIYRVLDPGKYRIRAVYDHVHPGSKKELTKEYGYAPEPWWIKVKTPFIDFEVLP